jgi:hypothetical protein
MSEFNYETLAARIAELKVKCVDVKPLIKLSCEALRLLEIELKLNGFIMPSDFVEIHKKKSLYGMHFESERLVTYYRIIYMTGFLYKLLSCLDENKPLNLFNLDKVRISFQSFESLNGDEKIIFMLRYRFKDFHATARWLRDNKDFSAVAKELDAEKSLVLAEVDKYFTE